MPDATHDQAILAKELADKFAELKMIPPRSPLEEFLDAHPYVLEAEKLHDELYKDHDNELGKRVSRDERQQNNYKSPTLVYGEITFLPFAEHFMKLKDKYGGLATPGGTFVDIGTGTGRPVFAAALLHDFSKCVGIELLEGLTKVCREVHKIWDTSIRPRLSDHKKKMEFEFLQTDATLHDWTDADVCFANSTCFSDELMDQLAMKADSMKVGSFFITTTRRLPTDCFEVLETCKMTESWGVATIFLQRRLAEVVDI